MKYHIKLKDRTSHITVKEFDINTDGYMSALTEANLESKKIPNTYVGSVVRV